MSTEPAVTYEVRDNIAVITLNRPEKLNAMSASLLDELEATFTRAKKDDACSVVLLQGAGRAFERGVSQGDIPIPNHSNGVLSGP